MIKSRFFGSLFICYNKYSAIRLAEDDIYTDFVFSNTGNIGNSRAFNRLKDYTAGYTKKTEGDTLQEKCCNYLLGIGVTEEQLMSIHNILLGE